MIREGDQVHTGYMLLLLGGEVLVRTDGEGAGYRSLGARARQLRRRDGAARRRAALLSCKAATPIEAAGLSRDAVDLLLRDHPVVCAKLMMTIAKRLADRLRAAGQQLRMYAQLQGDVRPERGAVSARAPRSGRLIDSSVGHEGPDCGPASLAAKAARRRPT